MSKISLRAAFALAQGSLVTAQQVFTDRVSVPPHTKKDNPEGPPSPHPPRQ
jgi:hypothetical protein